MEAFRAFLSSKRERSLRNAPASAAIINLAGGFECDLV